MAKSTISMAIFNSYVSHYQRVKQVAAMVRNFETMDSHGIPMDSSKANKGNVISRFHKTSLEIRNLVGSLSELISGSFGDDGGSVAKSATVCQKMMGKKNKKPSGWSPFPNVLLFKYIQMEIVWNCSPEFWDKS